MRRSLSVESDFILQVCEAGSWSTDGSEETAVITPMKLCVYNSTVDSAVVPAANYIFHTSNIKEQRSKYGRHDKLRSSQTIRKAFRNESGDTSLNSVR